MPYTDISKKRAYERMAYQNNKEKRLAYSAEHYKKNRDKYLEARKLRYANDKEGIIKQTRAYRVAHFEEYSAGVRERSRHLKMEVLLAYGGTCACAGCDEWRFEFLTIDHINGGGAAHRKTLKGASIYRWLKKNNYPPEYQVLCMNCNFAKGMFGYCPHTAMS